MNDAPELVFAWEKPLRFRWAFFGLLVLSALVHVATFFLFQIVYPPRVTIPPPAPEVSLLLPTSPENRALLRRIEAEDPALIAATTATPPPGLLAVQYHASYETVRTQPRTVAEENAVVQFPSPKDPLAIIRSGAQTARPATVAPLPVPTRVTFSTALAARARESAQPWGFSPRATAPLEPATFLIGITDRGEVRYVFLQRTSGDPALDAQAAAQLPHFDFAPAEIPIVWSFATVMWGDDAYGANLKSEIKNLKSE